MRGDGYAYIVAFLIGALITVMIWLSIGLHFYPTVEFWQTDCIHAGQVWTCTGDPSATSSRSR